jgi:TP901 family phage tail tape measure protein|nr:MAG TPA: minor tail protein [Caudoviricetes sp.]
MADAELSVRISGDASDLESAISGVEKSLKGLEKTTANATNKVNKETEKTANAWKQTGEKLKNVGEGIDTVTKPIQRLSTVTAAGAVASAKFAIDFENNFANVEKTVDGTDSQLKKIKQDIIDMTTVGINGHSAIPQTTAELTELAAAGGQLGIQTENISSFTETMAMMGSATNLAGEEGAKTLARFMNVTATSQDKVQNLGSAIVDLGNHFATTEAEIADMAMNMGATGSAVGISAQDILAYSTALSSLGVEAAAGGSSVSRIWMDIQSAVSSGGKALDAFAKISGKSATQFADDWKSNASGAFKDMLTGLSKSKDLVGDLQKLGFENIRDLQALQKLAGPQGIQLLNDALDRSNRAWGENTALLNEFEKKAGTTASQLEVTKNNLIEAGRSVGEVLLPAVNSGAVNVKEFAQGIAKMNDTQKQALVTTGKWVIGLGAASKVTASGIKFVGSMAEGVAKIKQFAPALASVGSVAPQAALGIAAVTTAVVVGKKAYDAWYKSQYSWTEGLAEQQEKIRKSMNSYKQLSDIQGQLKNYRLIIENPESSQEQVDNAKAKIEEIKKILSEEYNLVIKSDNSNLDTAVEDVKKLSKNELIENWTNQQERLTELQGKFNDYQKNYAEAYKKYETALTDKKRYSDARREISELKQSGLETSEYLEKLRGILSDAGFDAKGTTANNLLALERQLDEKFRLSSKNVTEYKNKVDSLNAANKEYIAISTEMANWASEGISMAVQAGDTKEVSEWFDALADAVNRAKLNMHDYAQIAAESFNGITWDEAFKKGGDDLNNMVNDYIRSMQKFGAANSEVAKGAALLKNGFKSINDIPKDNKKAFEAVSKDMTDFARNLGAIDGNHSIKITASGDIQVLDDISGKIQEIQTSNGTTVKITAEGDVSVLDNAGNQVQYLEGIGAVSLQVNANGNIDVLNEAGEKVAEIPKEVDTTTTVKMAVDSAEVDNYQPDEKTGTAKYGVDSSSVDNWSPPNKNAIVLYKAVVEGEPKAKGTRNFEGGLAMVNDQKGTSDPREMIEVGGKGYIFEGKDVVLPLPKHAKVYTASQTKQMMNNAGIPRYANGKNNKAWENAKANWAHYTKINNVSAIEQLEHWDNMMIKFKNDAEVIKEIQEEIVASTKDMWNEDITTMQWFLDMGMDTQEHYYRWLEDYRDEHFEGDEEQWRKATLELHKWKKEQAEMLNTASEEYIKLHSAINDWASVGDGPLAAFERVRERMRINVEDHLYTEEEANEYLKQLGSDLYSTYAEDADNWMQHERDYNAMSVEDYAAALTRKKNKLSEFLSNGIGEYTQYVEDIQKLDERIMSAYAEGITNWRNDADFYQRQAEVFGWGFNGTGHKSAEEFWQARLDKELENAADTNLSENERQSALRYADEARMEIYKARQNALDEELEKFRDSIENIRTEMDDEVQKIRDSWTKEDRTKDITETERQLALFRNAQTKEGMDKYKSLQDELLQLQREEQIADIEADNNERLVELQMQYERMERAKIDELAGLKDEVLNYGGISKIMSDSREIAAAANENIGGIIDSIESFGETFSSFKNELFEHMEAQNTGNVTYHTYNTSQNISNNIRDSADAAATWLKAASNLPMNRYGRRGW